MKGFFCSKAGVVSLCCFTLLMAVVLQRVVSRSVGRAGQASAAGVSQATGPALASGEVKPVPHQTAQSVPTPAKPVERVVQASAGETEQAAVELQENLAYLDTSKALSTQSRIDRDRRGRQVTKRKTSKVQTEARAGGGAMQAAGPIGESLRLRGHGSLDHKKGNKGDEVEMAGALMPDVPVAPSAQAEGREGLAFRFCPFGRPIKCELVFTIDSTMEETPLVGLVMEPVYNNGVLVIPAGAELHGMARPDRLRDRIFSSQEWVLLMPREEGLPNGRQLRVKGLALDRIEPDANGLTWGITDGAYGLQGAIIRSMREEEIQRFAATFLSAAAFGLEERETSTEGHSRLSSTPRNAALQGLGTSLEEFSKKIAAEISRNGVFLRVAGGKQFYFYPQQAIFPDRAVVPVGEKTGG